MMGWLRLSHWILGLGLVGGATATQASAQQWTYTGSFEQVTVLSGDEGCADLFSPTDFTVRHFLTGPSRLTSVLHFVNDRRGGWLEGRSFVGLYDYSEIYAEESFSEGGYRYEVESRGLVDRQLLLVDVKIVAYDMTSGNEHCAVMGEFAGFH